MGLGFRGDEESWRSPTGPGNAVGSYLLLSCAQASLFPDRVSREEAQAPPVNSGFTPINLPKPPSVHPQNIKSIAGVGSKTTARNRAAATEDKHSARDKKRKAPASENSTPLKKPRRVRTIEGSREHDISKDLQRTKPAQESRLACTEEKRTIPTNGVLLLDSRAGSKLPTILEDPLQEDGRATSSKQGSSTDSARTNHRRPGLAEKYQAASHARLPTIRNDSSSPQSFQLSSDAGFEEAGEVLGHDNDESIQLVTQGIHEHSIDSQIFEDWNRFLSEDFEPPPSAQIPKATIGKPRAVPVVQATYHVGPDSLDDDLDLDDVFFDEVDQMGGVELDNKPTALGEAKESLCTTQDEDFEDEFDNWPDDLSLPDAVTVYDEGTQGVYEERHISPAADSLSILAYTSGNVIRPSPTQPRLSQRTKRDIYDFNESDLESSPVQTTSPMKLRQPSTPQTSPHLASSPKLQWLPPKTFTPKKSQCNVHVPQTDVPHLVPVDAAGKHLPFARPPFPAPLLDRSPILGLSNATVLRTCFRIGEALNAATQASRSKADAIVELYARVSTSTRDTNGGCKQHFQFVDLFTDNAPYLIGTSTVWKGVGLWDQDSKVFLGEAGQGKMCRAIGRMKRGEEQPGGGWEMVVLSVWEVEWEDVGVAKGIACS